MAVSKSPALICRHFVGDCLKILNKNYGKANLKKIIVDIVQFPNTLVALILRLFYFTHINYKHSSKYKNDQGTLMYSG